MHFKSFKGCCWLSSVFITTKNIILILLCKLLFKVTKPWLICGYMASRIMIFGFSRVKTMANFRKGTWNRLLDVLGGEFITNIKTLLMSTAKQCFTGL